MENVTFARVDADTIDNLIKKDDKLPSKLSDDEQNDLKPVFQSLLDNKFTVVFDSLSETDNPIIITQPEFMRRMKDMQKLGGQEMMMGLPEYYNLVVNANHPMVYKLHTEKEEKIGGEVAQYNGDIADLNKKLDEFNKDEKSRKEHESEIEQLRNDISEKENKRDNMLKEFGKDHKIVKQLIDLALLSQNMLTGEALNKFIKRSYDIIEYK